MISPPAEIIARRVRPACNLLLVIYAGAPSRELTIRRVMRSSAGAERAGRRAIAEETTRVEIRAR